MRDDGRTRLDESLTRLGAREVEERLETAPLLVGGAWQGQDAIFPSNCCNCKSPQVPTPDNPDGEGLPAPPGKDG
jgi:hypothetical protein